MLKAYRHLTRDQRCQIYALKKRGLTQTIIAVDIGVSQGTVSRELTRNKGFRGYRFLQAHRFAMQRSSARRGEAHVMTPCLIVRVEMILRKYQWSPEQICGALNLDDGTKVSHESLYRHIWSDKRVGGTLYLHLRQRGKKRNKRGSATAGRGLIPGRIDIAQRQRLLTKNRASVTGKLIALSARNTKVPSPVWSSAKPSSPSLCCWMDRLQKPQTRA